MSSLGDSESCPFPSFDDRELFPPHDEPEMLPLYDPARAKRYERIQKLGAGAFGEVSLVRNLATGTMCASKSVNASGPANPYGRAPTGSPQLAKPVFREMHALQRLQGHPNVVALLDVYPQDTQLVLVFEFAPSDLEMVIDQAWAPLAERHIRGLAHMLLRGLAFIHSEGILHRDIKPGD